MSQPPRPNPDWVTEPPPDEEKEIDLSWRQAALLSRQAAALLGYKIASRCFPDESTPCGGGWGQHVAAQLGVIKAVADHQLMHLGFQSIGQEVYEHTMKELMHEEVTSCADDSAGQPDAASTAG